MGGQGRREGVREVGCADLGKMMHGFTPPPKEEKSVEWTSVKPEKAVAGHIS